MKIQYSKTQYEDRDRINLLDDIAKTRRALEIAYAGFDNVTDPDLIDCYIYEVNSVLKRYTFLLEQAAKLRPLPEESLEPILYEKTPIQSTI